MQLLWVQIPNAQKRLTTRLSFFALLGSVQIKAACGTLIKLTQGVYVCKKNLVWRAAKFFSMINVPPTKKGCEPLT